jgi:hypothetical protein
MAFEVSSIGSDIVQPQLMQASLEAFADLTVHLVETLPL